MILNNLATYSVYRIANATMDSLPELGLTSNFTIEKKPARLK